MILVKMESANKDKIKDCELLGYLLTTTIVKSLLYQPLSGIGCQNNLLIIITLVNFLLNLARTRQAVDILGSEHQATGRVPSRMQGQGSGTGRNRRETSGQQRSTQLVTLQFL